MFRANLGLNGRLFDRVPHFDLRNLNYTVTQRLVTLPIESKSWSCYTNLDQGNVGHCVGFGNAAECAARPAVVKGVTNDFGHHLFFRAQEIDRNAGRYYDDGATCLAGAKAMQREGYIDSYVWATNEAEFLQGLMHGPMVVGTWWKSDMFDVDANGYVSVSGDNVGGHCWLVRGIALKHRRLLCENSWGPWGFDNKGAFYVHLDDFIDGLLLDGGEALQYRGRHASQRTQ